MKLLLKRVARKEKYTIGKLYINGALCCDTIEDRDRGLDQSMSEANIRKIKVPKETAIPTGTYEVVMNVVSGTFSKKEKYKKLCGGKVPRLKYVKGFSGILIHSGVDQNSSAGCIIVGQNKQVGKVINSWDTFKKLYARLKAASDKGETITITIQ